MRKIDTEEDKKIVETFLEGQNLTLEKDVEYTIALFQQDEIIATGSLSGRILKCIAVDPQHQGMGISSKIITELVNEAFLRGKIHLFIYTCPKNKVLFTDVGFHEIAEVPNKVCLLENKANGIKNYVSKLERYDKEVKQVGAIVMNCNPFTLGHQYLIEKAAAESDILHIFVVSEDRSSFPTKIRYQLIQEGTKHLDNVIVHQGQDYIISSATFPSYFLKENKDVVKIQTLLDLEIFKKHIAPALKINKRFIGEEPYCPVTKIYNETMGEILPSAGIEVEEVQRIQSEGEYISASKVRRLIAAGELAKIKELVPQSTYEFLMSKEAEGIIEKIKESSSRH
ncbi:MAG: [citrate (pro-3S)-lyase] ligase [Clostridiaceae bacterium]|nr:[citrate (pro-3S)-lyase] ligase [Clostridiaceae bacterium]